LSKPSHESVLRVMDEFLQTHADRLIRDPVKRAILQRDLWAVFDWTVARVPNRPGEPAYEKEKFELQTRLAEVLRRLALTPEEIRVLPENYGQAVASGQFAKKYDPAHRDRPFLPPDLLDPLGPWVAIYGQGPSTEPVAVGHISSFSRSSVWWIVTTILLWTAVVATSLCLAVQSWKARPLASRRLGP